MMHVVFHLGVSKYLQTLINKVLLHICLVRMVVIPIFFRRAHDFPKFCNEPVTALRMKPGGFRPFHSPALLSKLTGKCVDCCKYI